MKKLGMTLLAAALSLPLTFGATQAAQQSTPSGQAQTDTTTPSKKHTKSGKKHHSKKNKSATTDTNSAAPATK